MPASVGLRVTNGRALVLKIWLDDGQTATQLSVAGGLAYTGVVQLGVVPRLTGRWPLWASATDASGCSQQTGAQRFVTVVP